MDSFLGRLRVESVPGIYCTNGFGHPVKACAFLRKGPRRCWKGELVSDIKYYRSLALERGAASTPIYVRSLLLCWDNPHRPWVKSTDAQAPPPPPHREGGSGYPIGQTLM
jgi:hypothetical protein